MRAAAQHFNARLNVWVARWRGWPPLAKRWATALVLIPIALGAVYLGGWVLGLLTAIAGVAMAHEWARMAKTSVPPGHGWIISAGLIAGLAGLLSAGESWAAVAVLLACLAASVGAQAKGLRAPWPVFGVLYVAGPCLAFIWLREAPLGLQACIWLLNTVWATDGAAYGVGGWIKGPKLAASISPNKTWSGALGGAAAAAAASYGFHIVYATPSAFLMIALGIAIAAASVTGDLAESLQKRHFDIKDASNLIPGHGGVLDRLDGMILATVLIAALTFASGTSPLAWRLS